MAIAIQPRTKKAVTAAVIQPQAPAIDNLAAYIHKQLPADFAGIHGLLKAIEGYAWDISENRAANHQDLSNLIDAIGGVLQLTELAFQRCNSMDVLAEEAVYQARLSPVSKKEMPEAVANEIIERVREFCILHRGLQ